MRDGHCHFVYLCCSAFAQEAAPAIVLGDTEHEAPVGMMGGLGDTIGLRPYVEAVCCLSMPSEFCASVHSLFVCKIDASRNGTFVDRIMQILEDNDVTEVLRSIAHCIFPHSLVLPTF